MGDSRYRLPPTGRDPPPDDREQTHAAFILGKHFDGAVVGTVSTLLVEHDGQGGLELGQGCRTFFACDGRGRVGFARSVPRTTA